MSILVCKIADTVFKPINDTLLKQRQFVSDASHELRTPITVISANADVLGNLIDNKYLDSIKSQTERLNLLVSDLLTLSKMDEGKLSIPKERFSLSQLINALVLPFEAVAFEKGKFLYLDNQNDIDYFGDSESVKLLVNILIDNAIKHSTKNATIKVSLKKDGTKILLEVYNDGSNIFDQDSDKVFERFYKGDKSRKHTDSGSGLGLCIAKNICDNNKWKITAKSKLNESFTITVIM